MIQLAKELSFPTDFATQTALILGKRGSGKTSTAVRLAEQLMDAGVPIVAIDPADVWWGLKASRSGGRGRTVYVFGGKHADLPLEPTAGALLADVIVGQRISAVLSVRHFTGADRNRFVTDFAKRLFQHNTEPLHVFLEEAHELAPQDTRHAEVKEECVGAIARLWKLGRSSGIGGSAITQRPASLNKNITTQAEVLVVHRTIGPQDVAAVKDWIKYHGEREDILPELSTLKTGEAFVWAPDFPERKPIGLVRVQILPRDTFDSSATPKAGQRRAEPKELAPVDLDRLRSQMAATIEKAKADDPKELRRRIAELEKQARTAATAKPTTVEHVVEVPALSADERKLMERAATLYQSVLSEIGKASRAMAEVAQLRPQLEQIAGQAARVHNRVTAPTKPAPVPRQRAAPPVRSARQAQTPTNGHGHLTGPEQRILDSLAWLEMVGQSPAQETAAAFLAGYRVGGGAWNNPRGRLNQRGLIAYGTRGASELALTDEGRALAQHPNAPGSAEELQAAVLGKLSGPEKRILEPLLAAYPDPIANDELARSAGYEPGGGAFNNPRGRLRSLGLITYPTQGHVRASDVLFLESA